MTDAHNNIDLVVGPPDIGWSTTTLKIYIDSMLTDRQRQHEQLRNHYDNLLGASAHERSNIREHYDVLINEIDKRYQARFLASEVAVSNAFAAQEKAISAALSSAERAVSKAELASDKRFDSVNEFRLQLADQTRTFMPRAEVEALLRSLDAKVDGVMGRMDRRDAQGQGGAQVWVLVVAGVGMLVGVAGVILAIMR